MELEAARREGVVVEFERRFGAGKFRGLVLDVTDRWFLLANLNDAIRPEGLSCLRLADVRKLSVPAKNADFYLAAMKRRDDHWPSNPGTDLRNVEHMLKSAQQHSPLVTVHIEREIREACYIGRVLATTAETLSLLEITPQAEWDREPTEFRLRDITRIDVGGAYEEALYLVGGNPVTNDQ
jgi:hypothetical protein